MSTSVQTMMYLAEQLNRCDLGIVTYKKMFGEYGVYLDGKIFSLVCDDRLFFKTKHLETRVVDELFGNEEQPFPGAKGYAEVSGDFIEDVPELTLRLKTVMATLPVAKAKEKTGKGRKAKVKS
jgi:TfoX/Sxy family transcriptional regulator of competence genes